MSLQVLFSLVRFEISPVSFLLFLISIDAFEAQKSGNKSPMPLTTSHFHCRHRVGIASPSCFVVHSNRCKWLALFRPYFAGRSVAFRQHMLTCSDSWHCVRAFYLAEIFVSTNLPSWLSASQISLNKTIPIPIPLAQFISTMESQGLSSFSGPYPLKLDITSSAPSYRLAMVVLPRE